MTNPFALPFPLSAQSNFLVYCPEAELPQTVRALEAWCAPAVHSCALPGTLNLPREHAGTLLLTRLEAILPDQQVTLFNWMTRMHASTRVVSVATAPIDRLVRQGHFLEDLFYRLNVLQMDMGIQRPVAGKVDAPVSDDARCRV